MLCEVPCQLAPQRQSHSLLLSEFVLDIDAVQLLIGQLTIRSVLVLAALHVRIASIAGHTAHVIVDQILLLIESLPVDEAPIWPLLCRCAHLLSYLISSYLGPLTVF